MAQRAQDKRMLRSSSDHALSQSPNTYRQGTAKHGGAAIARATVANKRTIIAVKHAAERAGTHVVAQLGAHDKNDSDHSVQCATARSVSGRVRHSGSRSCRIAPGRHMHESALSFRQR